MRRGMPWRRLLYLIPASVSALTAALALLCLLEALQAMDGVFPGFFFHTNGTVAAMQRGAWEGPAAGVRPGDVIKALDGGPVRDGKHLVQRLRRRSAGEWVTLRFRRAATGEEYRVELMLRRLSTGDILATFVLPYSIGVIYLLLGVILFAIKRSYEAALATSVCVVASVFYVTMFDAHTSFGFARLWVAYPLFGAVSVHLFATFPAKRPRFHRPGVLAVPYACAAAILALAQVQLDKASFAHTASWLSSVFLDGCFLLDVLLLTLTRYRDPSEVVRNKARTMQIGLLLTIAAAVVWNMAVRIHPLLITAERAMMLSALFPLLLGYVVIKKNIFDMDVVLRTTTTYAVATALVVALYFGVVFVVGLTMSVWTQRYVGFELSMETTVISTIIVALLFQPLRSGVQRVVNRYFFREKGILQEALMQLGTSLPAEATRLSEVARQLTSRVKELMRCRFAVLLCPDLTGQELEVVGGAGEVEPKLGELRQHLTSPLLQFIQRENGPLLSWPAELAEQDAELAQLMRGAEVSMILPLSVGASLSGILLLGPRPHGDVFTRFELSLLQDISPALALVLQNAQLLRQHADRERLAALGKLSAVIIHEIKNPLGIIRVSSGTLKKRFDPGDSGHELASFIEEEVVRMNHTIAQFLSFARPQRPKLQRFNLAELVTRFASVARAEAEQLGLTIEVDVDGPVHVFADPDQVQQVLHNLLMNAKQALSEQAGGVIRLSLRRESPRRGHPAAKLVVADNGPGIAPADAERIFEPFFTTRQGGTGLGLAIARQILGEQGGRIEVRRVQDETRFIVTLTDAAGAPPH